MNILITGGAGFIGSALIRFLINNTDHQIINVDKLTYAGDLSSLDSVANNSRYFFEKIDICSRREIDSVMARFQPEIIMHLAAESHVDRSIDSPLPFIETNIIGTFTLLEAARSYWQSLASEKQQKFRFHHISTDEVYGDLDISNAFFTEKTAYAPSSPYSASKASSDHLVRAWHRTYGLPVVVTNCSNNYGPYQFPEKLIPLTILNAMSNKPLTIYGDGLQIRDWLFVDDHAQALFLVATKGKIGDTYNIGGNNEKTNKEVVETICATLQNIAPKKGLYSDLITYVKDRPGHDKRYAIDASKIQQELGWSPLETFASGLEKTINWYLQNFDWVNYIHNKKNPDKLNTDLTSI